MGGDDARGPRRERRGDGVHHAVRAAGAADRGGHRRCWCAALVLPEENAPPKISVQDIVPLDNARVDLPALISIRVWLGRNGAVDRAQALEELFKQKPGATQVRFRLESPRDFSVLLDVPAKVRPDKEFRAAVEAICGSDAIERVAG